MSGGTCQCEWWGRVSVSGGDVMGAIGGPYKSPSS